MKYLVIIAYTVMQMACISLCAQEESEEIIVRLSTENQLIPLYFPYAVNNNSGFDPSYIKQLEEVLQFDLNHNGMTYTIDRSPHKDKMSNLLATGHVITSADQHSFGAFYVIKMQINSEKKLSASMISINGDSTKSVEGVALTGEISKDRRLIHQLGDAIHKSLFASDGIASTRFLYTIRKPISEGKWSSEIWEADYDGQNARRVVQNNAYNIFPIYAPPKPGFASGSLLYVSYASSLPRIYTASLKDGVGKRLNSMRSNQLMPSISRQRDKIAFISDITGNPDLFLQDIDSSGNAIGKPRQIFASFKSTQGSPTFSPDGKRIAFVSNKDGSPKVYVMDVPNPGTSLKTIKPQLISKHNREGSAPAWSPDGTKLAYCAKNDGGRQIWIYDFITKEERQLTQGKANKENPTWAPNSLCLMYNSSDANACEIYLININQPHATKITSGSGEKRFPNWEPKSS